MRRRADTEQAGAGAPVMASAARPLLLILLRLFLVAVTSVSGSDGACSGHQQTRACSGLVHYVLVVDNSAQAADARDNVTAFMHTFATSLDLGSENGPRVGIVSFSGPPIGCESSDCTLAETASVVSNLTTDLTAIAESIDGRDAPRGLACISCGIDLARTLLQQAAAEREQAIVSVLVVLSDGRQTVDGTSQKAIDRAAAASASGMKVVSLSYGEAEHASVQARFRLPSTFAYSATTSLTPALSDALDP